MSLNCSHDQKQLEEALKKLRVEDEPEDGYASPAEMRAACDRSKMLSYVIWAFVLAAVLIGSFWWGVKAAGADEVINVERLATAIYYAEGGANTRHPYGILKKYKHTTPRAACINTINHALRDWDWQGDFIAFLGSRYCPVGAENDPTGLNVNWVRNVTRLYARGKQ